MLLVSGSVIRNLDDRISETRMNGWHGERQGLETTLRAARHKLASLDRSIQRHQRADTTDLGMPVPKGAFETL